MSSDLFATVIIDVPPDDHAPKTSVEIHRPVKHLREAERRALTFAKRKLTSEYSDFRNRGTDTAVGRYLVASSPLVTVKVLKGGGASMDTQGRVDLPASLDDSAYDAAVDRIVGSVKAAIADRR